MKSFFRTVLAVIVGVLLLQLVGMVLFFMVVGGIAAAVNSEQVETVQPESVLQINLSVPIRDRVSANPMDWFKGGMLGSIQSEKPEAMYDVLKAIRGATDDERIKGIVLNADGMGFSSNIADEIRGELEDFHKSGKFIYAFSDGYGALQYFLASVADSVFLHPMGGMDWKGFSSTIPYLKGACEKFGIEPQVIRHGKYKSAVEPYLDNKMSPANREQTEAFLGSMWGYISKKVAEARGVAGETLTKIANDYVLLMPSEAKEFGLVDALCYRDQFDSIVLRRLGQEPTDKMRTVALEEYLPVAKMREHVDYTADKVAVVYAEGNIVDTDNVSSEIGGEGYAEIFSKLRRDSTIKAVVLRVNSPGGSALASETMWRELHRLKEEKPLIVSMGTYAASGGYYISAPADVIVADPMTITGSIGVFGMFMTFGKLAKDMLNVNIETVQTNAHSDMGSKFRPLDELERARIKASIEHTYSVFLSRVAEGRHMTTAQVDSIGQGRVWSGIYGEKVGLVDEFGGLEKAIGIAVAKAGLENYRISSYPKQELTFFESFMAMAMKNNTQLLARVFGAFGPADAFRAGVEELMSHQGIRAELPYRYDIK